MANAISEAQPATILTQREEAALEELRALGGRIALYEPRELIEADPLRGVEGGRTSGTCYVVFDSVDHKRKTFSTASAVQALDEVRSFLKYQERLKPESRWIVSRGSNPAPVMHLAAGDKATTKQRRENTERRLLSLDGSPHLVDGGGEPIHGDHSRATQYA